MTRAGRKTTDHEVSLFLRLASLGGPGREEALSKESRSVADNVAWLLERYDQGLDNDWCFAIYELLVRLDPEQARAALDQLPSNRARTFRGMLADPLAGGWNLPLEIDEVPATLAGRYTRGRAIGEGGMGWVFEAEQASTRQRVALKLSKYGLSPRDSDERGTLREAKNLGKLSHDGIARIHDADVVTIGAYRYPFLAMELVQGPSITAFSKENELGLGERLELIARVGEALEHAHRQHVIHLDIKPANILIAEDSGADEWPSRTGRRGRITALAVPKIVDWGISASAEERRGQWAGTRGFMSPEQVRGLEVDGRSDQYSLALVALLLTGFDAVVQVEGDSEGGGLPKRLSRRALVPGRWSSFRTRELQAIFERALAPEPGQRYDSCSDFARDLRNWIAKKPLQTLPATRRYVWTLFVLRRPGVVVAAALLVFMTVVSAWLWRSAERQRSVAAAESTHRKAALDILERVTYLASPQGARGEDISLGRALYLIGREMDSLPPPAAVEAHVRRFLGECLCELGELESAELHLLRAQEILESSVAVHDLELLRCRKALGGLWVEQGRLQEAQAILESTLRVVGREHSAQHPLFPDVQHDLAGAFQRERDFQEAERLYRSAAEARGKILGPKAEPTLGSRVALANLLAEAQELDEAEEILTPALECLRSEYGPDHPTALFALGCMTVLMADRAREALDQGQLDVSRSYFDRACELTEEEVQAYELVYPSGHVMLLIARGNQAQILVEAGELERGALLLEEVCTAFEEHGHATHEQYGVMLYNLALAWFNVGRAEDAVPVARQALEVLEVHGHSAASLAAAWFVLTLGLHDQERWAEGVAEAQRGKNAIQAWTAERGLALPEEELAFLHEVAALCAERAGDSELARSLRIEAHRGFVEVGLSAEAQRVAERLRDAAAPIERTHSVSEVK